MISLNEYIHESQLIEQLDFLKAENINEGFVKNKLSKLWKWIKTQFSSKSPKDDEWDYSDMNNYFGQDLKVEKTSKDKKSSNIKFTFFRYDYDKVSDKVKKIKWFKNSKMDSKSMSDLKLFFIKAGNNNDYIGMFAYVESDKSPYANIKKAENCIHLYTFNVDDEYSDNIKTIFTLILRILFDENKSTKGITIDEDLYKSESKLFSSFGFNKVSDTSIVNMSKTSFYLASINDILNTNVNEDLDNNLFYFLDMWFNSRDAEQSQFMDVVMKCKMDGATNEKKLSEYIKGTFLETHLNEFVNFVDNDLLPDENKNNIYVLKKIIDKILFDKTNKYIKKGED